MRVEPFLADTFLRAAVTAVTQGGYNLHQTLDTLPVPIYVTTPRGSSPILIEPASHSLVGRRILGRTVGALLGSSLQRPGSSFLTINARWRLRYARSGR